MEKVKVIFLLHPAMVLRPLFPKPNKYCRLPHHQFFVCFLIGHAFRTQVASKFIKAAQIPLSPFSRHGHWPTHQMQETLAFIL